MNIRMMLDKKEIALFYLLTFGTQAGALAAQQTPAVLKEVVVRAGEEQASSFKTGVEGTKNYSGKKASSALLYNQPQVQNNNYRQAFSQLPGLLVSEQNNHAHVNVNYRGIGDPHESQDLLTLKDGLPIGVERYGYSTSYYVPPMEAVKEIELIRGGSALLYGPQPGPALNYVTYMPPSEKRFEASTQHVLGSDDLYTTYNEVGGTMDRLGYLGHFHHRQADGQRDNEDFEVYDGSLKLVLDAKTDTRWIWDLDIHEAESGEPGRLTLAEYLADRSQTIRPFDTLETSRYASSLTLERDLSEDTLWTTTLYGGYFDRFSLRRTTNTSNLNNLDRREVYSAGLETRVRHDYDAFGENHTFTGGAMVYGADAPRSQERSATYPSREGTPIFDFDYRTFSGSLFGENEFRFGALSLIPAFRLEVLEMDVQENFNTGKTSPLHDINETFTVPLFGLGLKYVVSALHEFYANASQGYKPPQFDTLAPTGNNTLPATSLDEGKTWTYEAGLRGRPMPWLQYDASAFLTDYENYFGTVVVGDLSQSQNVGDVQYDGVDLSGEIDLVGFADQLRGEAGESSPQWGTLSLYGNVSFLSAEFEGGPLTGKEPAYAPNFFFKTGLIWRFLENKVKLAVMGTFVEDHYWADNNLAGTTGLSAIPAYEIWDFNGEARIHENVNLIFGINNLTDEDYFSRVRADGIEPAQERTYYGGVKILWG